MRACASSKLGASVLRGAGGGTTGDVANVKGTVDAKTSNFHVRGAQSGGVRSGPLLVRSSEGLGLARGVSSARVGDVRNCLATCWSGERCFYSRERTEERAVGGLLRGILRPVLEETSYSTRRGVGALRWACLFVARQVSSLFFGVREEKRGDGRRSVGRSDGRSFKMFRYKWIVIQNQISESAKLT